jgi:hypothetical protein
VRDPGAADDPDRAGHGPRTTPALFPTEAARLAYYVNGYNALALY